MPRKLVLVRTARKGAGAVKSKTLLAATAMMVVVSPAFAASDEISNPFGWIAMIIVLMIGLFLYFLPTCIALGRDHPNTVAIFLLDLFLGWTLLGWIAALVWSTTAVAGYQGLDGRGDEGTRKNVYHGSAGALRIVADHARGLQ